MRSRLLPLAIVLLAFGLACSFCSAQDAKPWEKPGAKVGDEIVGPDGGKMVWVPPGEYTRGVEYTAPFETPVHRVRLTKGFWLARCTVTNAQYDRFCEKTGAKSPYPAQLEETFRQGDDHPVVFVTWVNAEAYCKQYGLDLPTEAQWEFAARGPENRKYPWGEQWDAAKCCNSGNRGSTRATFPVGSFPEGASWCGALDMEGNVEQWCKDWCGWAYYDCATPDPDPEGSDGLQGRVVRGSDYGQGEETVLSRRERRTPGGPPQTYCTWFIGFRCAFTPRGQHPAAPK